MSLLRGFKWKGSADPEDKSGTAEYIRDDKVISFKLESFKLAHELDKFIDNEYERGYTNSLKKQLFELELKVHDRS